MLNRYYQQELDHLKALGAEFSKKYPAVAPMLSGPAGDPDVERLLEGVAFLTGLLRQKLDDEFPEIIHELIQLIWPHYLRPVPAATIIAFSPKPTVKQPMTVPAGIQIASVPIEGTPCLFRTCFDVELHPIKLKEASFVEASGRPPAIRLLLALNGPSLSDWQPRAMRFFLSGDYANAAELYLLLRHHLKQIMLVPSEKGASCVLTPQSLQPVGFSVQEGLIPYPSQCLPGYRLIQEYFLMPEKFLFLDLVDLVRWHDRGEGSTFEVFFELDNHPSPPPKVKNHDFMLSAVPAINVFPHEADPIRLDHRKTEYVVRPSGANRSHYQVYALKKVVGYAQGTAEERKYVPFEAFNPEPELHPIYHTTVRRSPVETDIDVYLSVAYPREGGAPVSETLSIELLCTNGSLPETLQIGDIAMPTSSTPEFAEFRNIRPPTSNVLPPLGTNLLWRLLSHLSLNFISLAKAENLRALLGLYIFPDNRDRTAVVANQRRLDGIEGIVTKPSNRLVSGVMMRGQEIVMKLRQDHFASPGDLYLFGSILDYFLGAYSSMNTYTQLFVQETLKGDQYQWPARVGDHPLI